MVQISSLLKAIPVLSQLSVSFSSGPPQPANGLAVRQSIGVDDLPTACQSPCESLDNILNTDMSLSAFCTETIGSVFQQCLSCIAPISPTIQSYAQQSIAEWNTACNGSLSLTNGPTGGSINGTTNGTGGNGTTGGTIVGPSGTFSSSILPTTSSTPSNSGNIPNPSSVNAGVVVGLETSGITLCIIAAIFGAFVSL